MSGHTQKDRFKRRPKGNSSAVTWVSPGKSKNFPVNALEVLDCDIGKHYIAREKQSNGTWHIRPSMVGKETFLGTSLQFLVVNAKKVCWQKGSMNTIPDQAVVISDGPLNKPNTFIGRNTEHGAGQVICLNESKFIFVSENGEMYDYDVLCTQK